MKDVNKMVDGKQCTILWHVDDLKISHHVSPEVVNDIIQKLEDVFGKEAPFAKTQGKVHEYLGMNIGFSETGKLKTTSVD